MGRTASAPLRNPYDIIRLKARAYVAKDKYLSVRVFTKYTSETDLLIRTFEGHTHRHGSGFYWMLTKKLLIEELLEKLKQKGFCPTRNLIEEKLLPYTKRD